MITNEKSACQGAPSAQQYLRLHSNRSSVDKAREVLRDAIVAAGVDDFARMAIIAAAESFARESTRAEFASFVAELNAGQEKAA